MISGTNILLSFYELMEGLPVNKCCGYYFIYIDNFFTYPAVSILRALSFFNLFIKS